VLNMENTKQKIREFLKKFIRENEVKDDDDIFSAGLVYSLFGMQLIVFVEEEFNIEVDLNDMDISQFNTINRISEYIEKKQKELI